MVPTAHPRPRGAVGSRGDFEATGGRRATHRELLSKRDQSRPKSNFCSQQNVSHTLSIPSPLPPLNLTAHSGSLLPSVGAHRIPIRQLPMTMDDNPSSFADASQVNVTLDQGSSTNTNNAGFASSADLTLSLGAALGDLDIPLGFADQACKECRRRKSKCNKAIPTCNLCVKYRRHCLYEKHSRTPLTRKWVFCHFPLLNGCNR